MRWYKKQKNQSSCQFLLALLGPSRIKSALKMLMKLTQGVNFINMLTPSFYVGPKIEKNSVKLYLFALLEPVRASKLLIKCEVI